MVDAGMYHEFECEIEDEGTNGIIKPQEHWNAKHKPVKLLGYELVEEIIVETGLTSYTFDNLDGNEDREYLVEFNIMTTGQSYPLICYLLPNDLSTNIRSVIGYAYSSPGTNSKAYTDKIGIGYCNTSANTIYFVGECRAILVSNTNFVFNGNGSSNSVNEANSTYNTALWSAGTNLTSIIFEISSGTFTGIIRLWKKLPLNIE